MRSLLDVNLLVALFDPDHIHHGRAHDWWGQNRTDGWASCPLTQHGFIRVLSQPSYPAGLSATAALDRLREATSATDHAFWSDDISILDSQLFNSMRILGPKQLTDIYLLGLAVRNDGQLATLDRGIPTAAVRGAQPRHLAII